MDHAPAAQEAQPADWESAIARLDAYMAQRLAEGMGPGIAVALTDREQLRYVGTYGYADATTRQPVTPDTLFEIGSIGKSFVALAILQLHDEGRLDLATPVTQCLPWFAVQSDFAPITIHHLLSHSAGLVAGADSTPSSRYEVWNLRHTQTGFAPGTHFAYSNVGYETLGHILEDVGGQPYAEAIQARVLAPLGMDASAPVITNDLRSRLAIGYWHRHDDRPVPPGTPPVPATWFETTVGSGSLACTPADLAAHLRMLLNRGQGPAGRLVSEEGFRRMITPVVPAYGEYSYGYGLFVGRRADLSGHTIISHAGEMIGYHAMLIGDLDDGLGVVVLINGTESGMDEADYILRLLQATRRGAPLPDLPPRRPAPNIVAAAADYAGVYRSAARTLTLRATGDHLLLDHEGTHIPLVQWFGGDTFTIPHPAFDRFILSFTRVEGAVIEAFHGPDWYVSDHYQGPRHFAYPPEWDAYLGHYRSYTPWMSNFRVFVRKGQLQLQWFGLIRHPLMPLPDGSFRVGEATHSPERLRFDSLANGQALRATVSGGDYYRVSTP